MIRFTTRNLGKQLAQQGFLAIDVSSYARDGWRVLSPRFPHGNIPIPGDVGVSTTVEGIWQGLKYFENIGIDRSLFTTRKPKKRRGRPLGHSYEGGLLDLVTARRLIYVPSYRWIIEHNPQAAEKFEELRSLASNEKQDVYVYDFDSNGDLQVNRPYAHAALLVDLINEHLILR